ncbi:MAG: ABC transporter substrate-binding protein [Solirubrobacterales bacterium]|nr:ABC transporter substrate-binding protein [Solirubrobacterales bacterium]
MRMLPTRRKVLSFAAAGCLALGLNAPARAADDIVIGASIPMTGVFAFAGVGINNALQDYVKIVNDSGGISGRKLKYVAEDTAYAVDKSIAAFNRITASNKVNLYYGDSTGFAKTINPELTRRGDILMAGTSFATELNDPKNFPYQFIPGPDYSQMIGILLEYIAKTTPGAKIALVNSDTEFGRDPIAPTEKRAAELGLKIVEKIVTPPTSVDVSTEVLKLRRANPDYTIFHGYVLAPLPEFMAQMKQLGLKSRFMGTFWSMDNAIWANSAAVADGYMGVMPYRYYFDTEGKSPMMEKIRQLRPEYQTIYYTQGFLTAMLLTEAAKRTLDAKKELTAANMKAALNSIKDFDTGGIFGVPISISANSVPVGRVYQYDGANKTMKPVSDWIKIAK